MVLDTMAMLVWDTMAMLVWDTMVMLVWDILAMVITMERGKLKLTLLFSTAPTDMGSGTMGTLGLDITVMLVLDTLAMLVLVIMDMVLAMDTMASVQHRWCNTFSCHCSESMESHTSIESHEIVIKEQIMFPKF